MKLLTAVNVGVLTLFTVVFVAVATVGGVIVTRARYEPSSIQVIELFAEGGFIMGVAISMLIVLHVVTRED